MSLAFTIDNICRLLNCAERYDTFVAPRIENTVVYFLLHKDDGLVYIGQTKNLKQRLYQHRQNKDFDIVFIKKIPNEVKGYSTELETLCLSYINKPTKYNKQYHKPLYLPNNGNPLDKNNFDKWVQYKLQDVYQYNLWAKKIKAEVIFGRHTDRLQRQKKNIFALKPIRTNDTSRPTI
jgi:hypothetical protein